MDDFDDGCQSYRSLACASRALGGEKKNSGAQPLAGARQRMLRGVGHELIVPLPHLSQAGIHAAQQLTESGISV